jgi:manganese/iron transport system permease protein
MIAVLVSTFSTVMGTLISYYADASTSACIVILQATIFLIAQIYQFIASKKTRR